MPFSMSQAPDLTPSRLSSHSPNNSPTLALPERPLIATALTHLRHRGMSPWGLHGLAHWWRVRHNGLLLASEIGADLRIVTLFAIFHDSHRNDDGADPQHGPRAAAWLTQAREGSTPCSCPVTLDVLRSLSDTEFSSLHTACNLHTSQIHHPDPTVAACFVADRLDLSRVGFRPDPRRMPAPDSLVNTAFIDAAIERERRHLSWPGGPEIESVWGVHPGNPADL